ncbi:CHAT domain-containing protein [Phenylobacterium sp.]|uniref:CHAT domain-containing protein n=1 Tax=Phenylobacterium sp. TaxID=1871053 RepID=UPI002F91FAEB
MFLAPVAQARGQTSSSDGAAYLREQTAAARTALARGDKAAAGLAIDKILSLIATLKNPEAAPAAVGVALSESIGLLTEAGDLERAWGLYSAAGGGIVRALPATSPAAALHRLREAELRQQVGDAPGAHHALDAALAALRGADMPPDLRSVMASRALVLKAQLSAATGDLPAAREALRAHPDAVLYGQPGRTPGSYDEVSYLAVRAVVAGLAQIPDPLSADALQKPIPALPDPITAARVAVLRAAGTAMALPPGAERQARLVELGRLIHEAAKVDPAWRRPGVFDQVLIALALTQAPGATGARAEAAFSLFQLAGRTGPVFDADALAALSQAKDELQRRTVHQALRLRARRDRLERIQAQRVAQRLGGTTAAPALLVHDAAGRLQLRDFNVRIGQARAALAKTGLGVEPPLAALGRLQAVLAPDEAVLAVTPSAGGYAYLCVRRDRTVQTLRPVDPVKLKLDTRLLQQALTATHAASEDLDVQFPVGPATRLYDALVRPFEPCLKPGDRIVWLSSAATAGVPLAALLAAAPPKLGSGYDLGAADWLVRRHAISYAGSAAVILAARSGAAERDADFDFLGVGDPVLTSASAPSVTRGVRSVVRVQGLAPLPETRDELLASARGFATSRLLLQGDATERRFRGEMVGAYRYLSFATHGLIRDDLQGLAEPALVLTPVAPDDPLDDGLLTANEIADLDLRALFVALSACNTANFDLEIMAQELPALASAFAMAGTPATLGTLWPVDSETGKRVVSGVFDQLRAGGRGPGDALAQAQRAFLAAPPGRAYLHPRFWAPFVILGDGAAARTAPRPPTPAVRSVEVLSPRGEVFALAPTGSGVAARFIADSGGAQGLKPALRATAADGREQWRQVGEAGGAARFLTKLGPALVTGGYAPSPAGRFAPMLQAHAPDTGALTAAWRGDGLARVDTFLMTGAMLGPADAVVAAAEVNLRDGPEAGGGRLHVLRVGPDLVPQPLFTAQAPDGTRIGEATITPLAGKLLVTYADDQVPSPRRNARPADDYDLPDCLSERVTWLELRDPATGALLKSQKLEGFVGVTAFAPADGRVLIGGSQTAACGEERKAAVVSVDSGLGIRRLYQDDSLGQSEVRALAELPGRRVLAAATKANVVDYQPPARPTAADPYALKPFVPTFSGMLVTLQSGAASRPKFLDSASNIYVTALTATPSGDILLGGSLAGQAAIFQLSAPAAR